jgi:predicted nucleic-acid-binding protein
VVLVETIWVLRVAYKFDRATSASALRRLISSEGAIVEDAELVSTALDAFEQGPADFSDYVILESARREGALPLVTFDVAFSKTEGTRVL